MNQSQASLPAARPTLLSIIGKDPVLQLKLTNAVSARRAKMTILVKGILTLVAMLGVIALFRVTFASAAEPEIAATESQWDADRVVRGLDLLAAKGPSRRGALKAGPRGTKAFLTSTFAQR